MVGNKYSQPLISQTLIFPSTPYVKEDSIDIFSAFLPSRHMASMRRNRRQNNVISRYVHAGFTFQLLVCQTTDIARRLTSPWRYRELTSKMASHTGIYTCAWSGFLLPANTCLGGFGKARNCLTNSRPIPRFAPVTRTLPGQSILGILRNYTTNC